MQNRHWEKYPNYDLTPRTSLDLYRAMQEGTMRIDQAQLERLDEEERLWAERQLRIEEKERQRKREWSHRRSQPSDSPRREAPAAEMAEQPSQKHEPQEKRDVKDERQDNADKWEAKEQELVAYMLQREREMEEQEKRREQRAQRRDEPPEPPKPPEPPSPMRETAPAESDVSCFERYQREREQRMRELQEEIEQRYVPPIETAAPQKPAAKEQAASTGEKKVFRVQREKLEQERLYREKYERERVERREEKQRQMQALQTLERPAQPPSEEQRRQNELSCHLYYQQCLPPPPPSPPPRCKPCSHRHHHCAPQQPMWQEENHCCACRRKPAYHTCHHCHHHRQPPPPLPPPRFHHLRRLASRKKHAQHCSQCCLLDAGQSFPPPFDYDQLLSSGHMSFPQEAHPWYMDSEFNVPLSPLLSDALAEESEKGFPTLRSAFGHALPHPRLGYDLRKDLFEIPPIAVASKDSVHRAENYTSFDLPPATNRHTGPKSTSRSVKTVIKASPQPRLYAQRPLESFVEESGKTTSRLPGKLGSPGQVTPCSTDAGRDVPPPNPPDPMPEEESEGDGGDAYERKSNETESENAPSEQSTFRLESVGERSPRPAGLFPYRYRQDFYATTSGDTTPRTAPPPPLDSKGYGTTTTNSEEEEEEGTPCVEYQSFHTAPTSVNPPSEAEVEDSQSEHLAEDIPAPTTPQRKDPHTQAGEDESPAGSAPPSHVKAFQMHPFNPMKPPPHGKARLKPERQPSRFPIGPKPPPPKSPRREAPAMAEAAPKRNPKGPLPRRSSRLFGRTAPPHSPEHREQMRYIYDLHAKLRAVYSKTAAGGRDAVQSEDEGAKTPAEKDSEAESTPREYRPPQGDKKVTGVTKRRVNFDLPAYREETPRLSARPKRCEAKRPPDRRSDQAETSADAAEGPQAARMHETRRRHESQRLSGGQQNQRPGRYRRESDDAAMSRDSEESEGTGEAPAFERPAPREQPREMRSLSTQTGEQRESTSSVESLNPQGQRRRLQYLRAYHKIYSQRMRKRMQEDIERRREHIRMYEKSLNEQLYEDDLLKVLFETQNSLNLLSPAATATAAGEEFESSCRGERDTPRTPMPEKNDPPEEPQEVERFVRVVIEKSARKLGYLPKTQCGEAVEGPCPKERGKYNAVRGEEAEVEAERPPQEAPLDNFELDVPVELLWKRF